MDWGRKAKPLLAVVAGPCPDTDQNIPRFRSLTCTFSSRSRASTALSLDIPFSPNASLCFTLLYGRPLQPIVGKELKFTSHPVALR